MVWPGQVGAGGEVVFLALYTHEYGPEAGRATAGRIYVECLDGIPLRDDEVCVCV